MKKETLLEIILGTVGGIIFSIGMCMCLITEWNLFKVGIGVAIVGAIILLGIILIYKISHPKKQHILVNWGIVATWVIGVIGALVMGFGMSKTMIENATQIDFIVGIIIGGVGLFICILNYQIYAYISKK